MDFRINFNCLLAAVFMMSTIILAILMAACYGHPVLPPALFAGHNANSAVVYSNVTGAGSKTTGRVNATYARNSQPLNVCCEPLGAAAATADKPADHQCDQCKKMCFMGTADVLHYGYLRHTNCRCHPVHPCTTRISYVRNATTTGGGGGTELTQNRNRDDRRRPTSYGSFKASTAFKDAYHKISCVSCISLLFSSAVYALGGGHGVYGHFDKHLMVSTALLIYVNAVDEFHKRPIVDDFRSCGIFKLLILINTNGWQLVIYYELHNMFKAMDNVSNFNKKLSKYGIYFHMSTWLLSVATIAVTYYYEKDIFHQVDQPGLDLLINRKILGLETPLKFSIFIGQILRLLIMLHYFFLFKCHEIQMSSIHPDLISLYKEKISISNKSFKISVLTWTVEFLNFLDAMMEWDFVIIHILHLLSAFNGILITLSLCQPLFDKILATFRCLKRKVSRNEVTVNPTLQS